MQPLLVPFQTLNSSSCAYYLHFLQLMQGEKVLEDFNIINVAGGSKKALIKSFEANVTNTVMDIHFYWAGRGTCCIPFQSTFGPLVSAIHVTQGLKIITVFFVRSSFLWKLALLVPNRHINKFVQ